MPSTQEDITDIKVDIAEIKSDIKYVVDTVKDVNKIKSDVVFNTWFCKVIIICFSLASMVILINNTTNVFSNITG